MRSIVLAIVLALLVASAAPASTSAQEYQPDNYCTTVVVTATANGYNVNATGAGRYARIRDLTASSTVIATDFGAGATAYTWTALTLDTTHQYQVQVSHTSLTTGYSTSGCLFTPPSSLGVVLSNFTATAQGTSVLLEWEALSEWDNLGYHVYRGTTSNLANAVEIAYVPSLNPGSTVGPWQYSYTDAGLPPAFYWYWLKDEDMTGFGVFSDPVVVMLEATTAVTLASFTAARPYCYRDGSVCMCVGKRNDTPYRVPRFVCDLQRR